MLTHPAECFQVSIIVIIVVKFSTTGSSEEKNANLRNKCDIDKDPGIIWPPKTEVLISPKVAYSWYHQNFNGEPGIFDLGELEESVLRRFQSWPAPGSGCRDRKYIYLWTMTGSIQIPTANLGFAQSSKKMSESDCNRGWQPEMAKWPSNLKYIPWTKTCRSKFQRQIWVFDHTELEETVPGDCDDRQPEIAI